MTVEVALAVPPGSLPYWASRLAEHGVEPGPVSTRFGESVLNLVDPHGLQLALVETADPREFTPWDKSPVPVVRQVRGLHGVRLLERSAAQTVDFLTSALGFEAIGEEEGWSRFALPGPRSGRVLDIKEAPSERAGTWGTGSVHHIAWRVPDDATELAVQRRLHQAGRRPTQVIDRFWFKSVYFKEPGGALFEVATDGPGFGIDETMDQLGARLVLPPWLETNRTAIESSLPPLRAPEPAAQASEADRQ